MQEILQGLDEENNIQDRNLLIALAHIKPLRLKVLINILQTFGGLTPFWNASLKELEAARFLSKSFIDKFMAQRGKFDPDKISERLAAKKIKTLTILDKDYPTDLLQIYDPPLVLFYQGHWKRGDQFHIGIVGSRRATVYGERIAEQFGQELASAGFVIVSGMARGIDSYAHKGTLKAGGKTLAVLGSGLDIIYPRENTRLAEKIKETGVLISEYPLGTPPLAGNFPARNRIIAGLTRGILVIEAALRSGALITADFALEVGREVFAVPGPITSPNSKGTNNLIKQGAKLVTQVDDIFDELGFTKKPPSPNKKTGFPLETLSKDERLLYNALSWNPMRVDELVKSTGWTPSKIQTVLTLLELHGIVEQREGRQFVRKEG